MKIRNPLPIDLVIALSVRVRVLLFFFVLILIVPSAFGQSSRITSSFDRDWLFLKADEPGAETYDFSDSTWRKLDVPHDWSIEGPADEKNPTGQGGGFMPSGVGWYRKHFTVSNDFRDRLVFIEFDGVMANSDVWINGVHMGTRPYGYISFGYDLTTHINFGKDNVIAVRADTSKQPASRWYTGAGIYRHVRLVIKNAVHIPEWGTFVSTPQVTAQLAIIKITTEVVNRSSTPKYVSLVSDLTSADGQ